MGLVSDGGTAVESGLEFGTVLGEVDGEFGTVPGALVGVLGAADGVFGSADGMFGAADGMFGAADGTGLGMLGVTPGSVGIVVELGLVGFAPGVVLSGVRFCGLTVLRELGLLD